MSRERSERRKAIETLPERRSRLFTMHSRERSERRKAIETGSTINAMIRCFSVVSAVNAERQLRQGFDLLCDDLNLTS